MSLYNMLNGVNPCTFYVLPMLDMHPDSIPRFRDCFISEDLQYIIVYTRVGSANKECGFGEEKLYAHPNYVNFYDDDFDCTYGNYVFSVPEKWKDDFEKIKNGELWSEEYLQQMIKVYPKLEDKFKELYNNIKNGNHGKEV